MVSNYMENEGGIDLSKLSERSNKRDRKRSIGTFEKEKPVL